MTYFCIKLRKDSNDGFVSAILYKKIIGFLRYLYNTRTNICQNIRLLNRFMEKPHECHLTTFKRVLRYIKDTTDHDILIPNEKNTNTNAKVRRYNDLNLHLYPNHSIYI